jgi:hypothetical protein
MGSCSSCNSRCLQSFIRAYGWIADPSKERAGRLVEILVPAHDQKHAALTKVAMAQCHQWIYVALSLSLSLYTDTDTHTRPSVANISWKSGSPFNHIERAQSYDAAKELTRRMCRSDDDDDDGW